MWPHIWILISYNVLSVEEIIHKPMEEFNDILSKHSVSEEIINVCRDIRRRGKNKVKACWLRFLSTKIYISDRGTKLSQKKSWPDLQSGGWLINYQKQKENYPQWEGRAFKTGTGGTRRSFLFGEEDTPGSREIWGTLEAQHWRDQWTSGFCGICKLVSHKNTFLSFCD